MVGSRLKNQRMKIWIDAKQFSYMYIDDGCGEIESLTFLYETNWTNTIYFLYSLYNEICKKNRLHNTDNIYSYRFFWMNKYVMYYSCSNECMCSDARPNIDWTKFYELSIGFWNFYAMIRYLWIVWMKLPTHQIRVWVHYSVYDVCTPYDELSNYYLY